MKNKTCVGFLSLLLSLFLCGCDTFHYEQYRIKDAAGNDTDIKKLKSVLANVANTTGLMDKTESSVVPKTVVFYTQPNARNFRVDLGARIYGDDVLIDLSAGFGPLIPPPEFKESKKLLVPSLQKTFGARFSKSTPAIPVFGENTNSPAK